MNGIVDAAVAANGSFLLAAFLLYSASFILFGTAVTGKGRRTPPDQKHEGKRRWDKAGFVAAMAGFVCHLLFFFTRWYQSGHIPVSNMYEFMTFLAMMIVFAVLVL
ncbi:MAG: resC, partial [Paenibacillaceae bacterium]|nr:resC [Paenibacillaceae bacterium]